MVTKEIERPKLNPEQEVKSDRKSCIEHTVRTFRPNLLSLGLEVKERYLLKPNDELVILNRGVAEEIKKLGDPAIGFTGEKLLELNNEERRAKEAFGPIVLARARQLGLANKPPYLAGSVASEDDYVGWEISRDKEFSLERKQYPLKLSQRVELNGGFYLQEISLDELHEEDSKFLRQQIRECLKRCSMNTLAREITYNLNLHQVRQEELLPEFMVEIAEIANPKERAEEVDSIWSFISSMKNLGPSYAKIINIFKQMLMMKINETSEGRNALINGYSYALHMAKCPTQTYEKRQENSVFASIYDVLLPRIHELTSSGKRSGGQTEDRATMQVLSHPADYVFYPKDELKYNAERNQDQKIIDFIIKTRDFTDTKFSETLQKDLPKFYDTLEKFQEWFSSESESEFKDLISKMGERVRESFGFEQLSNEIRRGLSFTVCSLRKISPGKKFDGVNINFPQPALLTNQHLEAILPLLVIRAAYKRNSLSYQKLTDKFINFYEERVKVTSEYLREIAKDEEVLNQFMSQTGITDKEINYLIKLSTIKDPKSLKESFDANLYAGLLNALVLEKQGKVKNMRSPAFIALLKAVYPKTPDNVWQNL